MKRLLITLSIILLTTITLSSQHIPKDTVVTITPTQLKVANLIFAEHEMLLDKVPLLESKISNLEEINSNLVTIDSLRCKQIDLYKMDLNSRDRDIARLQESLQNKNSIIAGSVFTTIILAILCVLK